MSAEHIAVNQQVYYNDSKRGWVRGVIRGIEKDKATVLDAERNDTAVVPVVNVHGFMLDSYDPADPDLFHVNDLHVATLLYCMKERYEALRQQYSVMGEMMMSVNPFRNMSINSAEEREKYLSMIDPRSLPPHIWQIAHKAFNAIFMHGHGNQSIVVSGESGSGKTENTKSLITYLGYMSNAHAVQAEDRGAADVIGSSLSAMNPVMESFGNARTVRNDNSSRFGKYIKLFFDPVTGVMVGGETVTYLLERSRIIKQSAGERNYHIFYEMLAGLSAEEKARLGNLKSAKDYKCLNGGNVFTRRGVSGGVLNDAEEFATVRQSMLSIGMSEELVWNFFSVLAAILHLMEVNFVNDANDKATIEHEGDFLKACELLNVLPKPLRDCFLIKNHTALVTILATPTEAEGFRNAFCKAIYVALFDRLVDVVNTAIAAKQQSSSYKYIGLLDIFGFEKFNFNSFEQICINYANESLQNHYNKYTFLNDEEECRSEGIAIPKVVAPDNSQCIHMFEARPIGIFSMLDEECHFKGGNTAHFTTYMWDYWRQKNNYFVQPKCTVPNTFGINHYAAYVEYNTDDWLEKNTDALKEDMYICLSESGNVFMRDLLSGNKMEQRRKQTVAIRFQQQLKDLRTELEATETQFIRCIKPNSEASPDYVENLLVGAQLESAGVLQTISLKRQGYPVRRPLKEFCRYFYLILPRNAMSFFRQNDYTAATNEFLRFYQRLYQWSVPNFAVGKTKVFLRADVWSSLERLVLRRKAQLYKRSQPVLRRWIAEYRERKRLEEERRQAELRRKREIREAKARACAHGIPPEKHAWTTYLASLLPSTPQDLLLDVVAEADTRAAALDMLLQITGHVPRNEEEAAEMNRSELNRLLRAAGIPMHVRQALIVSDIKTVPALAKLDCAALMQCGKCTALEAAMMHRCAAEWVRETEAERRMQQVQGTEDEERVAEDIIHRRAERTDADFAVKLERLAQMGFTGVNTQMILAHYNGDINRTVARLLYGYNMLSIKRRIRKHKPHTAADPGVQELMAIGTSKLDAKKALRTCRGNVEAAAAMMFPSD